MAKRVKIDPSFGVRINETELALLRIVAVATDDDPCPSIDGLAARVGKSRGTVRNSLRAMSDRGMITIMRRFLANGGQLENEYHASDLGLAIVEQTDGLELGVGRRED